MCRAFYLAVSILVLVTRVSSAQVAATREAATTNPAATEPASRPAVSLPPIPPSEIASRSESTLINIHERAVNSLADRTFQMISQDLPGMADDIDASAAETDRILASGTSLQNIRDCQSRWEDTTRTLSQWRSELSQTAKQIWGQMEYLSQIRSDWQQTLEWTRRVNASSEVGQRAIDTLRSIDQAKQDLRNREVQIWAVEHRVDAQDARVVEILANLQQTREQLFDRLLIRDEVPLWAVGGMNGELNSTPADNSLSAQFRTLQAYLLRHLERVGIHLLVLIFCYGILTWIGRRLALVPWATSNSLAR